MNLVATNDMDEIYEDPEYGEMGELEELLTKVDESEDSDDMAASVEAAVKQEEEIVITEAAAVNGGDGDDVNTFAAAIVVEDEAVNAKYVGVEAVKGDIMVKGSKANATAKGQVLKEDERVEGYETREASTGEKKWRWVSSSSAHACYAATTGSCFSLTLCIFVEAGAIPRVGAAAAAGQFSSKLAVLASEWGNFNGSDTWQRREVDCHAMEGIRCDRDGHVTAIASEGVVERGVEWNSATHLLTAAMLCSFMPLTGIQHQNHQSPPNVLSVFVSSN
ncbi:unnamed protein product [Closterium sp. Naga37s-1]|nr:unnamed protein product [Closterium sp. Naga37s-1]